MKKRIENIKSVLENVIPNKIFYGTNLSTDYTSQLKPYIVMQIINVRNIDYADNTVVHKTATIQLNLLTKNKDFEIEENLEQKLYENNISFEMISELINEDNSINRVYELREEIY